MGFFHRHRNIEANVPADPASTLGKADVLPPESDAIGGLRARGNAMASRATRIYKENPKLIGGLAVLAGALLLTRMKRPHH